MAQKITKTFAGKTFAFELDDTCKLTVDAIESDGLLSIDLFAKGKVPAEITVRWVHPFDDVQGRFTGHYWADRYIIPNWYGGMNMAPHNGSHVYALYSGSGENRATVGLSDTLSRANLVADVDEGESTMPFTVKVTPSSVYETNYRTTIRIDERPVPIYRALDELASWWAGLEGGEPLEAPDDARMPAYSTWYAYHHRIDSDSLVHEAALAKELGCRTVILDFGWQIDRAGEVDPQFGQWEAATDKFPDLGETADRIHALGMKLLVWFSVPHINKSNPLYEELLPYILDPDETSFLFVDPRYPNIREMLVERYARALREWRIDGFKLDFVDGYSRFIDVPEMRKKLKSDPLHDIPDLDIAVDRLLAAIKERLTAMKPDIMIEFRQNYTGPRMRSYGNIFRAMDCALGSHTNRFRTADIRMLAGNSVVHSDMFTWHKDESPEAAALQFINVLHAVPQISVRIGELSEPHARMLRYYTRFWIAHRDALQFGAFMPASPENLYPAITCLTASKQVTTAYNPLVVEVDPNVGELVLVNGSHSPFVLADFKDDASWHVTVNDCMGDIVAEYDGRLTGAVKLDVPKSGVATAIKKEGNNG